MPSEIFGLRPAQDTDEHVIREWLSDSTDCTLAIGHAPFTTADFNTWLAADDQFGWVLQWDGAPIGYGEVWVDASERDTELAHIVIAPNYRGRGLGQILTRKLYDKACAWQYPFVYMRLYPQNQVALACYQATGFQPVDGALPNLSSEWIWLRRACRLGS